MIYRIAEPADWHAALATGSFASADLAAEGFIHASERHQILRTAGKYYIGRRDLWLLEIDDRALDGMVVREDLTGSGMMFPHIYGPIPIAAIVGHFAFTADDAGAFWLPSGMAG
jgi:uncharacterized protein (DUF952 family)